MVQHLANMTISSITFTEKQRGMFQKRYNGMVQKLQARHQSEVTLKNGFNLFIRPVAPAVTLEEHLAICAENAIKDKAILTQRHRLESLQQLGEGEHLAEDDADELEHPDIHDGDLVQALFDYEADEPEEMHLTQHEVYIFRQIDEETQWYLLEAQTSNEDGK